MVGTALTINDTVQMPQGSRLDIRLFGPMEVHIGDRSLPRLRTRKGLQLLALLVLRGGRNVERRWLAGTLWPDCADADAGHSLRQTLCDLRAALGAESWRLAQRSPGSLRFELGGAEVDALQFDSDIERGDPQSLEIAVGVYRGPLLEDWDEEWCVEERRRREQAFVGALEGLAAQASACLDHARAATLLRRATATDGFREDLQQRLMESLAASGDTSGALDVYRNFRTLLWREMAASPSEGTTSLYRKLRDSRRRTDQPSGEKAAVHVPPPLESRPLPIPLTDLIGREDAVQAVLALLGRNRLVTLIGTGGIGKTRLALQIAEALGDQYEDGARFADLTSLSEPESLADKLRRAIGLPSCSGTEDSLEWLTRQLAGRQLLLVLDNCEHLLQASGVLSAALLSCCAGVRILVTSREPLGIRGETVWRVPPLEVGPAASSSVPCEPRSDSHGDAPAVRLFVERARAAESSFGVTSRNLPAITEICRRLDGLPLAIELTAARLRVLPVEEIAHRLGGGYGLVAGGGPDLHPRHHTLEATFRWSWDLLTEEERTLLRRLAAFAGGWTLEAAEAVCSGVAIRGDRVATILISLVDRSLVSYAPSSVSNGCPSPAVPARYRLLETIRQFAAGLLRESGEEGAVRSAHRDHYVKWAEEVLPELHSPDQAFWFGRMEAEHDNLRAALMWCRSRCALSDVEMEFRLVLAMSRFWGTYGHLRENRLQLESTVSRLSPDLPPRLAADVLGSAGWAAYAQQDLEPASGHYRRAIALYRQCGDQYGEAAALNYLACAMARAGDFEGARPLFDASISAHRALGKAGSPASPLNNLAHLALQTGDLALADTCLSEAAALCLASTRGWQLLGIVRTNQAIAAYYREASELAIERITEAIRLFHGYGAVVEIPEAIGIMGVVTARLEAPERAARLLGASASLSESLGVALQAFLLRERDAAADVLSSRLGVAGFAAASAEGRAMDMEQAVACALSHEA